MLILHLSFRAGDALVLVAAQDQIRQGFREKRSLNSSDTDTQTAIQHAHDVAKILRQNVVQGRRASAEDHTYRMCCAL